MYDTHASKVLLYRRVFPFPNASRARVVVPLPAYSWQGALSPHRVVADAQQELVDLPPSPCTTCSWCFCVNILTVPPWVKIEEQNASATWRYRDANDTMQATTMVTSSFRLLWVSMLRRQELRGSSCTLCTTLRFTHPGGFTQ